MARDHPVCVSWGDAWDVSKCRNRGNCGCETTCSVTAFPQGCSARGLYQMVGNVYEWSSDAYDKDAYERYRQGDLSSATSV